MLSGKEMRTTTKKKSSLKPHQSRGNKVRDLMRSTKMKI
jgi:hypothetical protein